MSEEKNKEPTEKRLKDARKEGEVAKSNDLTGSVSFLGTLAFLIFAQRLIQDHLKSMIQTALNAVSGDHTMVGILAAVQGIANDGLAIIVFVVMASAISAIAILVAQVGFEVSFKPVTPKPDAINPAQGLKRVFSPKALGDFARSVVKALLVGVVMYKLIVLLFPLIANSVTQPLMTIIQVSWSIVIKLCLVAALIFFIFGVVDYKFQKWIFIRKHRMSETEIKQEQKESEGDPHLKGKRKELAREIAFSPSLKKAIASSNAVVTNPTHYAVALQYLPKEFALPRIVAKGSDELAAFMRQFATEIGVPVISNPTVARALFKVPLQDAVPEELFEVVAAILQWVESVAAKQKDKDQR